MPTGSSPRRTTAPPASGWRSHGARRGLHPSILRPGELYRYSILTQFYSILTSLFSEAISQPRPTASPHVSSGPRRTDASGDTSSNTAREGILQEIAAVDHRVEALDSKITDLSTDSKSIRADIAGFQCKVTELDHLLTAVEDRIVALLDSKSELQFLRHILTDLEDRS
ncbi:hypothetical protein NDU88_004790 [Pleurodeles waltl]|uniref:Uncharacterized protein n=1 Tax=Pleurodeles waltl TaxID=8319 RepID=A0AAV7PFZ8_PLEWA|nr:hypothetical protein NDU88_004790 [Pleurodeles waltl]